MFVMHVLYYVSEALLDIASRTLTTIVGILISLVLTYVLNKPLDPNLPLAVVHHNAAIHYIVNLNFVIIMSNRNTGYQLQLFGTDKPIPVSRTFTPQVKERLERRK